MLWKSYFGLLRDHFGECGVEELLLATQGPLWPVCCAVRYSGTTLAGVLWGGWIALLRDHFGQCAMEDLSWATQGPLW